MKRLDLLQETLAFRACFVLALVLIMGNEGAASVLGRRENNAGGILKVEIGEESQSTLVEPLSSLRDKLSNK